MTIAAFSLLGAWNGLIVDAARGSEPFELHPTESIGIMVDLRLAQLGERIPLALGGFQSRRWLRYVDDYLDGGPSFLSFLQSYARKPQISRYSFRGSQRHTKGSCLLQITLNPRESIPHGSPPPPYDAGEYIYLHSRACDICPTGLLDLTLLWWVGQVTGIQRAWWEIDRAKLTVWQSVARKDIRRLTRQTPLGSVIHDYLERYQGVVVHGPGSTKREYSGAMKFARARSMMKRRNFLGSVDEEEVILNPVRINPNDLQLIYGVDRTDIQAFLKREFGWAAGGTGNHSYSWSSYRDPIFQAVLQRFDLDSDRLPPIHRVAESRARRLLQTV